MPFLYVLFMMGATPPRNKSPAAPAAARCVCQGARGRLDRAGTYGSLSLAYGGVVAAKRSRGALVKEKDPHGPTVQRPLRSGYDIMSLPT